MKIISWNCNGAFRKKFSIIQKEDADIYVIQECENPEKYPKEFSQFLSNYLWVGETENKGLAIFAKPTIKMSLNNWPTYCLRCFLSVKINNTFDLVGVWACEPYIAEYYIYQSINIDKYNDNTLIIGDFNSNAIWDGKRKTRNYSNTTSELKEKGIISAYHHQTGEKEGKETQGTFYMYRHVDKPYHIDYCFTCPQNIKEFSILNNKKWIQYSDHLPIQIVC